MKFIYFFATSFCCSHCFAQTQSIYGTYFMVLGDKSFQGCCGTLELVKLNNDHTFFYYRNNDQGDYQSEATANGTFQLVNDSILFESNFSKVSNPSAIMGVDSVNYSGFKLRTVKNGNLRPLQPIDNGYGTTSYEAVYKKFDIKDFDSLTVDLFVRDSVTKIEDIIIKKDKSLKLNYSFFDKTLKIDNHGVKKIVLSDEKYTRFLKLLTETTFYVDKRKEPGIEITSCILYLHFNLSYFNTKGRLFSKSLYQFLFNELIAE